MRLLARDLACVEAVELVTDYLEGALSRRARRRYEHHLAACDGCEAYLEQVRATIRATGQVEPKDLEPETLDALVDLYRQFRAEDAAEPTPPTDEPEQGP